MAERRGGVVLLLWLGSCALRNTVATSDLAAALAEADESWAARAEPGKLDAAMDRLHRELAVSPDNPELLARLARGEWTRGQLGQDAIHFEIAQDYGYRCLLGWSAFAAQLGVGGYRITPEAAAELPADAAACLTWTIASGLGQLERRGPGGALELESLRALHDRLSEMDAAAPGFTPWTGAKLALLGDAPETKEVRRLLAQAIAEEPGVLLFRKELAEALPDARNTAMEGFAEGAADAWALENAAWRGVSEAP